MRRLNRAGFQKNFVSTVILPEWWDPECTDDPNLLPEIGVRVARFLGSPVSAVTDPTADLKPATYQEAHLRRVRDIDRDRLAPAIHSAIRIAEAVLRNLKPSVPDPTPPPSSGLRWREEMRRTDGRVTLSDVVGDLWMRGVPVVPVEVLPAPAFQGLAAIVQGRPVILVGHRHDEPGRVAFLLAHEAGHVAFGDCAADAPVVDQDEEIVIVDDEMEQRADRFAAQVLVGSERVPEIAGHEFKDLAKQAAKLERETGADASSIIFSWAHRTGDYATATMAAKALYRASGARRVLVRRFAQCVDLDAAAESDRELLRSVASIA